MLVGRVHNTVCSGDSKMVEVPCLMVCIIVCMCSSTAGVLPSSFRIVVGFRYCVMTEIGFQS